MQVIESATGARVLPFMGDQNATVSEWAAHTVFDADLRTKSSVHRQLASKLHIQGDNND